MKYIMFALFTLLMVSLIAPAFAEQCGEAAVTQSQTISTAVPKALEGATILVYDRQGQIIGEMSAEAYKVVPRTREELVIKRSITCRAERQDLKPNRVVVLGGVGPTGELGAKRGVTDAEVEAHRGLVLGIGYSRQLNDRISAGVQVQDGSNMPGNTTVLIPIGFDF